MIDADDGVRSLLTALATEEDRLEVAIDRVLSDIPGYRVVSRADLLASLRRNTRLAVRTLAARQVPPAEEIWEAEKATLERLQSGLPIEDIMAGFRVSIGTIEDKMVELARHRDVTDDEVLALTRLLWQLSDAFSARAAAAYRRHGMTLALAEQRRQDQWLLALLAGSLDAQEIRRGVAGLRLDPDAELITCCTPRSPEDALEDARQLLVGQFRGAATAVVLPSEGRLVGILPAAPKPVTGLLIALGPPATPSRLADSALNSRRVLAAAELRYEQGVYCAADLGWRMALPASPDVTASLRHKYLEPMEGRGAFGAEVLETLRTYLEHERSIPATARALHLHVNTLRYRLQRFEQLTGCTLTSTDTLVELAWVLYPTRSLS